jgi:uncharacterized protein (DUF58 family)
MLPMLSATVLASPAIALTNLSGFQFLVAGALLLGVAALLLALSRERRVSVKRSAMTDELAVQMGRIADALERIASYTSERARLASSRRQTRTETEKADEEAHRIAYSMFGR